MQHEPAVEADSPSLRVSLHFHTSNGRISRVALCMYVYYIDFPKGYKFFERFSSFTHTILYRYRLINRCQPVPVRFSGPELVAPHLVLDEQL